MFNRFITTLYFLLYCVSIYSNNKITLDFDYSIFKDEGSKAVVEFYYAFNPTELLFVKTAAGYEASGKLTLEVVNKTSGKTALSKDFKIPLNVADTAGFNKNFKLTGQINVLLDSGIYEFKIAASDYNDNANSEKFTEEITISAFPENSVALSTIQLATDIVKSNDAENLFYKNTLEVTPNPSLLFGSNLSKIFYYLEIYNIKKEFTGDSYSLIVSVADQSGAEIKSVTKSYQVANDSKVEIGTMDIADLPTNKYLLAVKFVNNKNQELAKAYKSFYVYNKDVVGNVENMSDIEKEFTLSEYYKMPEDEVVDEFEKAIYIMPFKDKEQFEGLKTIEGKRMAMFKFWKYAGQIVIKKEYYSRIEYSNNHFKSDYKEGWKTDRGRIYCIYGKYDDIQRYPFQTTTRSYEIWAYNKLQGGAIFVFIDMSAGYGDYILAHSTAQNEIRDDNWRERLNIR